MNHKVMNYKEMYQDKDFQNERNYLKFQILHQWMKLRNRGIYLKTFFANQGISSVVIYGMGELGILFAEELKGGQGISIAYGIDQGKCENMCIPVYSLADAPDIPEAVVITPVLITDEIEDKIYERFGEIPTYTMEEVMFELSRKYGISSVLWNV